MKVLIVDDMPTVRRLMKMQFEKLGVTDIALAADGAEAWKLIETAVPAFDIIISDWNMPVCTGLDLLKRVRSNKATARVPFFLVTAEGEADNIADAKAAGVTAYVKKPFDPVVLVSMLAKYLDAA